MKKLGSLCLILLFAIKKMRKKYLTILLSFFALICVGQNPVKLPPLINAMQKYADTTFVLKINDVGGIVNLPMFYFLSKKDTLINIYYYGDLTKGIKMPIEIERRLKGLSKTDTTKANVNIRFSPQPIKNGEAKVFWNEMMTLKPWQLKDDETQQHCPDKSIQLYDGSLITMFLITKVAVKQLKFYNPSFYESKCPGNKNRMAILKIQAIYKQFFGF